MIRLLITLGLVMTLGSVFAATNVSISQLPELTTPETNDVTVVVDVSDTTQSPAGTTKKQTWQALVGSIFQEHSTQLDGIAALTITNLGWVIGFSNGVPVPRPTVQIAVYSTPGTHTWTNQWWISEVRVILFGGGGGGGSGMVGAAGTARIGGAGGGSGTASDWVIPADVLGNTEEVVVGAGGIGGAAVSTPSTNGNHGTSGGLSRFGAHLWASANNGGQGGIAGGGNFSGSKNARWGRVTGGSSSATGGEGGTPTSIFTSAYDGTIVAAGGGAGGGVTSENSASAGASGGEGIRMKSGNGSLPGGTAGSAGSAGGHGTSNDPGYWWGGSGGGGGGGAHDGNGGAGGNGGFPGGGGGGGGAATNGNTSGAGGNGGGGLVVVIAR